MNYGIIASLHLCFRILEDAFYISHSPLLYVFLLFLYQVYCHTIPIFIILEIWTPRTNKVPCVIDFFICILPLSLHSVPLGGVFGPGRAPCPLHALLTHTDTALWQAGPLYFVTCGLPLPWCPCSVGGWPDAGRFSIGLCWLASSLCSRPRFGLERIPQRDCTSGLRSGPLFGLECMLDS